MRFYKICWGNSPLTALVFLTLFALSKQSHALADIESYRYYGGIELSHHTKKLKKNDSHSILSAAYPSCGLFAGKKLNEFWDLELGIIHTKSEASITYSQRRLFIEEGSSLSNTVPETNIGKINNRNEEIKLSLIYLKPLVASHNLYLFGEGGFIFTHATYHIKLVDTVTNATVLDKKLKARRAIPLASCGVVQHFNKAFSLRAGVTFKNTKRLKVKQSSFAINPTNAIHYNIGIIYKL